MSPLTPHDAARGFAFVPGASGVPLADPLSRGRRLYEPDVSSNFWYYDFHDLPRGARTRVPLARNPALVSCAFLRSLGRPQGDRA